MPTIIDDVIFDFPGNVPIQHFKSSELEPYQVIETGLISFVNHTKHNGGDFNLLFIDKVEKWSSGVYRDDKCTNYVYCAGLEADLEPNKKLCVGTMYLQPCEAENPYIQIRDFVAELGFEPCEGGITEGVMYSCHPTGTMDNNFPLKQDLFQYADYLPNLKEMGIDHVWLLPVFENVAGVYHSTDQSIIEERYGGEEGAKIFIDKAHQLDLRVLFDLVPHGPRPIYAFAKEHDDWVSKKQNGENQIEWECVSFDYNNPGYYNYTVDLLAYYASEFGLDGARIDCSMGGLSNWQPVEGLRPSSSGLAAGLNITKATREGFLKGGVNPILLPENFHPIPTFAQYTDVFYDMPLFRAMHDFNHASLSEAEYVKQLSSWLEAEHKTSVRGQVKLRFLGNHDTVTWTFDAERPQTLYGTEKAKALWSLLSFIDGVPFIYQGDEDPATYHLQGENLEAFFTDILSAREKYLPADYNISYQYTDTPIFAFTRYNEDSSDVKLVLVNLSSYSNSYDLGEDEQKVAYHNGAYAMKHKTISLDPYSAVIIQQ